MGGGKEHASERFGRLLALYRKPDGSEWGGQLLEEATGGAVSRSYVSNLKKGRIENPGLAKLEAIAGAMGFPPELWFGGGGERRGAFRTGRSWPRSETTRSRPSWSRP